MLRFSFVVAALLYAASASCPEGLTLTRAGLCLTLAQTGYSDYFTHVYNDAIQICNAYRATPIIIRNQQDQDYWTSLVKDPNHLVIGLHCNTGSQKWEWADGSPLTYRPAKTTHDLSLACTKASYSWYIEKSGQWYMATNDVTKFKMDIYCQYSLAAQRVSDDDCSGFAEDSDDYTCYQVSESRANFTKAQRVCAGMGGSLPSIHNYKENNFLRRLAVANGLTSGGMLLGGVISTQANTKVWADGTAWNYDNFVAGFPTGLGQCLTMQTNDIDGKWFNADCEAQMPFACAREPYSSVGCMGAAVKEGDFAYSPGFPGDATVPCDLFFTADFGKKVEVEIVILEANTCCDRLVIYEGFTGNDVIATLTGEISEKRFRTKYGNTMRISWQPRDGVNVKGVMAAFRSV